MSEQKESRIKACPHCNGSGELTVNYSRKNMCYFVFVKCSLCGAQGKVFSTTSVPDEDIQTLKKSVDAWNMRYTEAV